MADQHRATPELWAAAEKFSQNSMDMLNCMLELRARVEALEADQHAPTTAIEPVPVGERLPGLKDCDAEGRCWLHGPHLLGDEAAWVYGYPAWAQRFTAVYSHWLPCHALPVPQQESDR
jgi:hypothetical protein